MKTVGHILAFALIPAVMWAQSGQHVSEQQVFNVDLDGPVVQHPVVLSDAELDALTKDDLLRSAHLPAKLSRAGLETSVIHLGSPQERDLVVIGSGFPFMGANTGPFWIIRDLPTGPQVVLSVVALAIYTQNTRFHGFKNIEAFSATAVMGFTTVFRFDGGKYIAYRKSAKALGKIHLPDNADGRTVDGN